MAPAVTVEATDTRTASSTAPPTCREAFSNAEATPARSSPTPDVAATVTGSPEMPKPAIARNDGTRTWSA